MLRNEIMASAAATSGIQPGAPGFLGEFQKTTTVMLNALEPEERAIYAKAATDWTADAPPPKVQSRLACYILLICYANCLVCRLASSMRQRIIEDFQRQLYKTCGIRTLVLTAYEGEEHDLRVGMCVSSDTPASE